MASVAVAAGRQGGQGQQGHREVTAAHGSGPGLLPVQGRSFVVSPTAPAPSGHDLAEKGRTGDPEANMPSRATCR